MTISILPDDGGRKSRYRRVHMVDCSIHGLGILSPAPLEPGKRFFAKLTVGGKTFDAVYTSSRCTPQGKKYHVGAEFGGFFSGVEDDPDEILKALMSEAEKD